MQKINSPTKPRHFSSILRDLSSMHPQIAAHLSQAQSNRERLLSLYFHGARLRGYEELITRIGASFSPAGFCQAPLSASSQSISKTSSALPCRRSYTCQPMIRRPC